MFTQYRVTQKSVLRECSLSVIRLHSLLLIQLLQISFRTIFVNSPTNKFTTCSTADSTDRMTDFWTPLCLLFKHRQSMFFTNNMRQSSCLIFIGRQLIVGQGLVIIEASRSHSVGHTHTHTHSVGLPIDHPNTETSTWRHTTFTRDRFSHPRRDSNP